MLIPRKKAHEYLWFAYSKKNPVGANKVTREPSAGYVERVYEEGNFLDLEIGNGEPAAMGGGVGGLGNAIGGA